MGIHLTSKYRYRDPDRYPSRALSSDRRQYIALGMRKLGTERSRQVQAGSVSPWLSSQDVWVDDVGCSRETDHKRTRQKDCLQIFKLDSMMEMRKCRWLSKLSAMKKSRSPRRMLGAWCPTPRPVGRPQQTIRHAYISTLKKVGFEEEKGQLREWMTVARR
jgi:hypothetical protein